MISICRAMVFAQRNMTLRFYQVLMNEPQVHGESIRQQPRLAY